MAEEPKNIRLKKVATDFNVGVSNIIDFLDKKGMPLAEHSLNARLTHEQYELLEKEFKSERKVKEEAAKIEISTGGSVVISAEPKEDPIQPKEDDSDIIIKNFCAHKAAEEAEHAVEAPMAKEKEAKAMKEENKQTETPKEEHKAEEKPVEQAPVEEKPVVAEPPAPKPEPQVISATVAGSKDGSSAFNAELHIVDKINLDSLNTKVRPEKKSKEKRKKEKEAAKQASKQNSKTSS